MLYIKFKILNTEKFIDFQKLYQHMVKVRMPDFEFKDELEDELNDIDWETVTEEELDSIFIKDPPEEKRYNELFPNYAKTFLERYLGFDNGQLGPLGVLDVLSILNYLEYGFEVDLDKLEKLNEDFGLVDFSTGNFPYGGMERFLMVLKAFDLIPDECYDGFNVYRFDWTSEFEHNAIDLPEETEKYLKSKRV